MIWAFWFGCKAGGSLLVFAVEVILLTLQVRSEEKRLEADFGEEYRTYKQRVPRYFIR